MRKCKTATTTATTNPSTDPTRAKILKAAAKQFAEKGFSGTSLSAIAKTAKITQSLIHHHFGTKENLWHEIKHNFCSQYTEKLKPATEHCPKKLRAFLEEMISCNFDLFKQNPESLRMRYWQRLEVGDNQKKLYIDPLYNTHIQAMKDEILQLQNQGEIQQNIEPEFIILLIGNMAQSIFDLKWYYTATAIPQKQKRYISFIIDSLYRAIKNN